MKRLSANSAASDISRQRPGVRRLCAALLCFVLALGFLGCSDRQKVVVVYTSQDQIFAEPIFADFTRKTGIKVLPVFDSESVKTAGLVQRLLAEKGNPKADIFWSNEEMLAGELTRWGALDSNSWARVGWRARRLIFNTNLVKESEAPKSMLELTDPKWAGKVAMAYPIYGTTAAHMVALRGTWGDEKWRHWCEAFAANDPKIVDGNSIVVRLVGAGEVAVGLTDSDDFAAGLRNNLPIACAPACGKVEEFTRIPNSIGVVVGAPHPAEARELLEFLQSPEALDRLVKARALEEAQYKGGGLPANAPVEETRDLLKTLFARK